MPDDVPLPPEPDDDSADEQAEDGATDDDAPVVEIDSAALEALAQVMQQQTEALRRATEPITSAWLQLHADSIASISRAMAASVDTSGIEAIGKTLAGRLPKFELPSFELSALKDLQAGLARLVSSFDFEALKRAWDRGRPPNWHDLGDIQQIVEAAEAAA